MGWINALRRQYDELLLIEVALVLAAIVLAFAMPRLLDARFRALENRVTQFSMNKRRTMLLVFAFPILYRLWLGLFFYPPQPVIHDEYSYLLIGDTLSHFRLTNPTHPLWRHFESIHIFHNPTYASKYPIGQGLALAVPQWFGLEPYWGVWLSNGLMSMTFLWMMQAWMRPGLALVGTLLVVSRVTTLSSWMHSYWGGAMAATGGALAFGALFRLMKKPTRKLSLLLGLGLAILANTRPYEGSAVSFVLGLTLLHWLWKSDSVSKEVKLREVVMPLAGALALTGAFMAYYNWRVTGDPLKLPYQRNRELYGTPQSFYWQKPVPPPPVDSPHLEIRKNYLWQLGEHERGQSRDTLIPQMRYRLREFWLFYFGPAWLIPLLGLPWLMRRSEWRVPVYAALVVMIANCFYPFFFPHYLAPVAAPLVLLILGGLQVMRTWKPMGRPVGLTLSRLICFAPTVMILLQISSDVWNSTVIEQQKKPRTQVIEKLTNLGGKHLVVVRYSRDHNFHLEFVYNAADIDDSPIVWARDLGPLENRELLDYYKGRKVWVFEPDHRPGRLVPYEQVMPLNFPGFR